MEATGNLSPAQVIGEAQEYMSRHPESGLGGWLLHDYRRSNPIFWQALVGNIGTVTRPCYFFIPATGGPRLLVHHVDAGKFQDSGVPLAVYRNRQGMVDGVTELLASTGRVAMEYSPQATIPRASKVDAGTVELVRGLGVEVVSSADLLQYATQRWSQAQLSSHLRAAELLGRIVLEAFAYIGRHLSSGPTEFQVAEFIRGRFSEEGLHSPDGPIVAVNEHASDPHYEPSAEGGRPIGEGDWVLIDLWAREPAGDGVYADITWVGYVGEQVPQAYQEVFEVVANRPGLGPEIPGGLGPPGHHPPGMPGGPHRPGVHRPPWLRRTVHTPPGTQHRPGGAWGRRQPGRFRDGGHQEHHPGNMLQHRAGHLPSRVRSAVPRSTCTCPRKVPTPPRPCSGKWY